MGPVHNAVDMTDDKVATAEYPRNTPVSDSSCLESFRTSFWPGCLLPTPERMSCRQRTNLDTGSGMCLQVPIVWTDLLNKEKQNLATRGKNRFLTIKFRGMNVA